MRKSSLSSIELHVLIEEFQKITGARVGKIYNPDKKQIIIELYKTGVGKRFLRYEHPFLWLSESKPEAPEKASSFVMSLRRLLEGSFIKKIEQLGSERVVEINLTKKDKEYILIIELFSKGNTILTDAEKKIIQVEEKQKWADRVVEQGEKYILKKKQSVFELDKKEFISKFISSKDNVSKTLAVEFGLGGAYSEEVCIRADLGKNAAVNKKNAELCFNSLNDLLKERENSVINEKEEVIDIVPFKLKLYEIYPKLEFPTFSEAIDSVLIKKVKKIKSQYDEKIEQIQKRIEIQEMQEKNIVQEIEENQKKAEYIYKKYQEIKEILDKAKSIKDRKKLKELPEIKDVKEKEGIIVVDVK